MKAKPIFLVGLAARHSGLNDMQKVTDELEGKINDYHVIVYNAGGEETKFQVLNAPEMTEIEFDELKALVIEKTTYQTGITYSGKYPATA